MSQPGPAQGPVFASRLPIALLIPGSPGRCRSYVNLGPDPQILAIAFRIGTYMREYNGTDWAMFFVFQRVVDLHVNLFTDLDKRCQEKNQRKPLILLVPRL